MCVVTPCNKCTINKIVEQQARLVAPLFRKYGYGSAPITRESILKVAQEKKEPFISDLYQATNVMEHADGEGFKRFKEGFKSILNTLATPTEEEPEPEPKNYFTTFVIIAVVAITLIFIGLKVTK